MKCRKCGRELDFYTNGRKTIAIHKGSEPPANTVRVDRLVSVAYQRQLRRQLEAACNGEMK